MCGIAGIFRRDRSPLDPKVLLGMTRALIHRGPDEEGYLLNGAGAELAVAKEAPFRFLDDPGAQGCGYLGLGHRRLSIIDLATGQQPLSNEDETIWIAFNGEIYNFQDLHRELVAKGHRFRTRSDTEAIIHAYEEWGAEAVKRFRGMFAFALWDGRKQRLWLARDRVGKKPLYYFCDGDRILFGSEIKAILEAPAVPRRLDLQALSDYLSLHYIPSPQTIFQDIRKLPAAHYALVTSDRLEIEPYWDLSFEPDGAELAGEEAIQEELLALLEEATRMRLISEVPLGAFLSGGVDSSAVVAFMARCSENSVLTSSISFSHARFDEARYARQVARLFGTDHHEFKVTPEALTVVEKLAHHFDEPFADPSAVPTFYVSRTAREKVTVALSGDGGDENFAGYRRYFMDLREGQVRRCFPSILRKPLFGLLGRFYPEGDFVPHPFRAKAFLSNLALDPAEAYCRSMSTLQESHKQALLKPELWKSLGGYRTSDRFRALYAAAPAPDHLSRLQYLDIKTHLCEDILTKVDRASMAVSLEVRCPILDHPFMEFAARLPSRLKLKGGDGKHIFKKALRRLLPDEILYRRKMGFAVPVVEWLRSELRDYARDAILEGPASREYFRRDFLEKIWKEHQGRARNWGMELWIIFMANLWHQNYMGTHERPA